jgi:hypothetical protein
VDKIQARFEKRQKAMMGNMDPMKLTGALDRGSAGAYSIVTRYQVQNSQMNPANPERVQADLLRKVVTELQKVGEDIRRIQPIHVFG